MNDLPIKEQKKKTRMRILEKGNIYDGKEFMELGIKGQSKKNEQSKRRSRENHESFLNRSFLLVVLEVKYLIIKQFYFQRTLN